jgi:hypothetical protein
MSSVDVADDYAGLLQTGWVETLLYFGVHDMEGWEPWYEAMEALAAADGLVVLRSNAHLGAGSFTIPAMEIGRPDGRRYGFKAGLATTREWREQILPAIQRDWGELLQRIRAEHAR